MFAPSLTSLSIDMRANHIICCASIEYENGAKVSTSFVTNLGDGETVAESAPDLSLQINNMIKELRAKKAKQLPKYEYPSHVLTAARMQYYAAHGIELKIKRRDSRFVRALDMQREHKKQFLAAGYC